MATAKIPYEKTLDNSLALMREGYLFIKHRMRKYQTDLFETRLMGEKVICITGQEAAELFYDPQLFVRNGAAPKRIQKTLFGENAVQSIDGEAHANRKSLFMSVVAAPGLLAMVSEQWETAAEKWGKDIVLFDEASRVLTRAVCKWAGVPLKAAEVNEKSLMFCNMVDAFGAVGPRHWKGMAARKTAEKWAQGIIEDTRAKKIQAAPDSALHAMAFHREIGGGMMDAHMAGVELINVLRPTVAVATYITFAALALYKYPECREKLKQESGYMEMFIQEIRRYYPLGPFLGARVKKDFEWRGCAFKKGMLVILDIYGTDHDIRIWKEPDSFRPERFRNRQDNRYDFIPQGGGDPAITHRCPGEGVVMAVMKASVDFLVNRITYEVPEQDLSYSLSRMPTLPKSKIILRNVKRISIYG